VWVRKRRFWWTACNPDEPVGLFDSLTFYRAKTREGAIDKVIRAYEPREVIWEEIIIGEGDWNLTDVLLARACDEIEWLHNIATVAREAMGALGYIAQTIELRGDYVAAASHARLHRDRLFEAFDATVNAVTYADLRSRVTDGAMRSTSPPLGEA